MDRIHFIEHAIERLDDEAFAAFLTWFDHYADMRWAGRCAEADMSMVSRAASCAGAGASWRAGAHAAAHAVAQVPSRVCEPPPATWSTRAALEE
jgi:hypothetical protein